MLFYDSSKSNNPHFLHWNGPITSSLIIISIKGYESLSSPYCYEVHSQTQLTRQQVSQWHGESVSFSIGEDDKELPIKHIHGVVTKIRYMRHSTGFSECIFTIEPSLSLLNLGRNMGIWQNITVPELVSTLLCKHKINNFEMQLHKEYLPKEYCVQYRESSFNFIQRLLEEEGIYYFFHHSEEKHTLIITDNISSHSTVQGEVLKWHHDSSMQPQGNIDYWATSSLLAPAEVSLQGFNMEQASVVKSSQKVGPDIKYADTIIFSDITPQEKRNYIESHTRQLMTGSEVNSVFFNAHVNAYWCCSGDKFFFSSHPTDDNLYIIKSLTLEATNNLDDRCSTYNCDFQAIPGQKAWLPPVQHISPTIPGVLTAVVVGPNSEEIYTDEYGRIKIQFLWNQNNQSNSSETCWVRVVQPWAGGKYGGQFIPRVGNEVLVSFVQGQPDCPIVIGAVYNGQNMPPFQLPSEKNESGFFTQSTSKGVPGEGHRLSFNDKKGEERFTIISQKDFYLTVKNQSHTKIGSNRTTELTKGDEHLLLKRGNIGVTLENGNIHTKVSGNIISELRNGDYSIKVNGGGGSLKTDKALVFESLQSIDFKVGNNKISISSSGVLISGTMITIEGKGVTELKGAMTTIVGSGMTRVSGGIINIG
ncbi:type VI secretion system Vgr family protein [Citrobacter cronae]|uniref:type VI secretion system Vgr family protein n=1 Tax=Citrobacter cronae TaxID=1748967 RepID=UPI001C126E9F|nr:type VI secretion system tip protein TssI/VgrG [Citrobacter cronae]MBU5388691.1 type VI secretion system tip protein VgrG [Citrobacter cronae]